ncbi:MAG: PilX N-terminal domain-containing pilus assembly protein [Burkholderiales bacterium]|nr:PilX N-terminal domain-containing pilus assembly protein [Burkholderiales bacterium]
MKHLRHSSTGARQQRGAAALVVTTLLFFVMVLVTLFVNRNLVFEQRASANQYRATQAFEAAEAGAEWALAQLNDPQRIGPDCLPTGDASATSFRSRYLSSNSAAFAARTWINAGLATTLQPTCVRSASGWNCSCPTNGAPTLSAPEGDGPFPAFSVQFAAGDKPGTLRVLATGCTSLAGVCLAGSTSNVDATARIDVTVGLLAGLRTPPSAALTTRGNIDADGAAFGAHNADPATGLALHAGTGIAASNARLTTAAGAPLASAQQSHDAGLAALSTDRLFASYFGLDKARWKSQPAVQRIVCGSDCAAAIADAAAATDGSALVWIDGDLVLDGPVTVGSALQPVVIVVDGTARLRGAVALHGVLYSAALTWNDTAAPGAVLRGAALSETTYTGNGAPDLVYDSGVLATLATRSGSFARINGGWRDF